MYNIHVVAKWSAGLCGRVATLNPRGRGMFTMWVEEMMQVMLEIVLNLRTFDS
jgi:hypothetical protein